MARTAASRPVKGGATTTSTPCTRPIRCDKATTNAAPSAAVLNSFQFPAMTGTRPGHHHRSSGLSGRATVTPGSTPPLSMNSSDAPPPVDTWSSSRPGQDRSRPPPNRRRPRRSCPCASPWPVPPLPCPWRTAPARTCPWARSRRPRRLRDDGCVGRDVSGPMSRPIQPSGMAVDRHHLGVCAGVRGRGDHHVGGQVQVAMALGGLVKSLLGHRHSLIILHQRCPHGQALALKKVKHMAPPIRMSSAMSRNWSMTPILSATLAPPMTTAKGRPGAGPRCRAPKAPSPSAGRTRPGGAWPHPRWWRARGGLCRRHRQRTRRPAWPARRPATGRSSSRADRSGSSPEGSRPPVS